MVTLSVLYPKTSASRFDHDYYRDTHTPLVKSRLAPESITILRGLSTPDGPPVTYELMALISFTTLAHLQSALATHGPEVIGDIPNFTDVQPIIQINE
ncbi:MAG: EthD family reductase [Edaphobacter sp.]|uniref:EthD family reductase n=1 Tax=Edaphobacter sp. TaxID=1934404 RepID=UPI002395FC06|nr:EthD family reductase [Edaphobacter sp.]MDE1177387.1 EthD family reductase [Edaphobacter sp.]